MSIEVDWGAATSGPDGEALAERIRSFIHDKFQQVALPRFIRSVQVHSFDFGTIPPELEIKDLCEPFADFYEEDEDDEASDVSEGLVSGHGSPWHGTHPELNESSFRDDNAINQSLRDPFTEGFQPSALRSPIALSDHLNPHFRSGTPGIPGGTSTLGYHLMSLGGLSGTQTPLAAVAGGSPFAGGWNDSGMMGPGNRGRPPPPIFTAHQSRPEADIDSSNPTSRPSTSSTLPSHPSGSNKNSGDGAGGPDHGSHPEEHGHLDDPTSEEPLRFPRMRERRPEDFQVLCHAKYAGDVRLSLTAEILLDYPMPSFVGLPLKLNVTGITFDGVAVVAYIRKRVHFCFLSSEDADALIGSDQPDVGAQAEYSRSGGDATVSAKRQGGLLQEIRVESEIGRKEDGKQVLKNVGKVERFVLAQVRRIFEEELVYPSFWTFLV
ncbi:ERMES complex subunit MDM12 [Aspergillus luchuensis]|uniref:Mitochondrial distribution and morphology protein 12 n=1 Tax=Aspergillus kawachii TaxID=1069201 RepID=A0A146FAB4_ASPKA|nr:mitochondrial distribution and morphology protein 12 [Aspergillus luchuensis]BCR93291.1 mitochondrial distribution and morphology protein 12 [Aspergillus luchuensis]BCS05938.1 mitochondrial distribution and morphology protein 12 [Aspergillus luchuensis]GAA86720.1 mitochondrial distribution and morphology protein 12 [Aspergillus luchuensis IFO 4308]GAT23174.1 mitochondrial distribution and morphology protein 12 [Aspergillus luchuensis]